MESNWLACSDPDEMLKFLAGRASDRKLRLFVVAVSRRVWGQVTDKRSRAVVEAGERFADGVATAEDLHAAYQAAPGGWLAANVASCAGMADAGMAALWVTGSARALAAGGVRKAVARTRTAAGRPLCMLLRELFGNPFRPVAFDPTWRTPTVLALARAAYEERALHDGMLEGERLAILTDSLEEAGCLDADLLGHLRGPGPHVRGCWALDALLNRA